MHKTLRIARPPRTRAAGRVAGAPLRQHPTAGCDRSSTTTLPETLLGRELRNALRTERAANGGGAAAPPPVQAPAPAPAPASAPAPAPAGAPGQVRQVAVQPVVFRSGPADPSPTGVSWASRFASAQSVWGKLGVSFTTAAAVSVDNATLKASGSNRAGRDAVRAAWSGTGVGVFMVDNDIADAGGAATVGGGAAGAKIAMSDRGTSVTLLAHELGHVFGLDHPPSGADANTIMEPSGSHSAGNPTRNTIGNYNRITWPAGSGSIIIHPDP